MQSAAHKLILGTVQFGLDYGISNRKGKTPLEKTMDIFALARQKGIRLLDTAHAYGIATEVIGNYNKRNEPFDVMSKFTAKAVPALIKELNDALLQMKISSLYAWMYHRPQDMGMFPEIEDLLRELLANGIIRHAGASIYSNEDLEKAIDSDLITVIQMPFNLMDNYARRGELMEKAKQKGKEIHVRSIFLQGLLLMDPEYFPASLRPLLQPLEDLYAICREHHLHMKEMVMRYAFSFPAIDGCVIGVNTPQQLENNLEVAEAPLPQDILDQIHRIQIPDAALLNPSNWK